MNNSWAYVRLTIKAPGVGSIMCICVNCHYVDRCVTYHAVEGQHQQPHLTETPNFDPNEPLSMSTFGLKMM